MAELVEVNIDSINKEDVEPWANEEGEIKLSDTQWKKIAEELDGRINNFIDNLLYDIIEDIREGVFDETN